KLLNMEMNFYDLGRNIDEMMRKFKANIYMGKKTNEVLPVEVEGRGRQDPREPRSQDGRKSPRGAEQLAPLPAVPSPADGALGGRGDRRSADPYPPVRCSCPAFRPGTWRSDAGRGASTGSVRYQDGTSEPMANPITMVMSSMSRSGRTACTGMSGLAARRASAASRVPRSSSCTSQAATHMTA